jgi:uncharacterized protein (DUF2147 family)
MKLSKISLVFALLLGSTRPNATEYVYRDLMANTLPGVCAAADAAKANAEKDYTIDRFAKRFCQLQGYGWHVEEIKDKGKLVCTDCKTGASDKKQCNLEDVVVTCKRVKPGSVGMLPGQS